MWETLINRVVSVFSIFFGKRGKRKPVLEQQHIHKDQHCLKPTFPASAIWLYSYSLNKTCVQNYLTIQLNDSNVCDQVLVNQWILWDLHIKHNCLTLIYLWGDISNTYVYLKKNTFNKFTAMFLAACKNTEIQITTKYTFFFFY